MLAWLCCGWLWPGQQQDAHAQVAAESDKGPVPERTSVGVIRALIAFDFLRRPSLDPIHAGHASEAYNLRLEQF